MRRTLKCGHCLNEFPSDDGTRYFDSEKTDQVLAYTSKREKVISEVISYVTKYGIDGINIDFELISQEGADDYIEFHQRIVYRLPCEQYHLVG